MAASLELGTSDLAKRVAAKINDLLPRSESPIYYDSLPDNLYTCKPQDSGKWFIWNGTENITILYPDSLPDGFQLRVSMLSTGTVTLDSDTRVPFINATFSTLAVTGSSVSTATAQVVVGGTPGRFLNVSFDNPLPSSFFKNTGAAVRNSTAMSAIPGMTMNLDANSVYDIDMRATFGSLITTNSIKLGMTALPAGATCQLEGMIYSTNVLGTAAPQRKTLLTSAELVTGVAGSVLSSISGLFLGKISGRIITGSSGGSVSVTMGAIAATGNVTVAAGAATMTVKKFQ